MSNNENFNLDNLSKFSLKSHNASFLAVTNSWNQIPGEKNQIAALP
jgi:hypothetical protein